jgi:hypothetical protein
MAARQLPPAAGRRGPATTIERVFERKVRLSKWALLFEQLWPRAWIVLGLAGLFIGVSLVGLWPRLPELPHKIALGLFALAFAIALVALLRVRWPSREQAIRRVEAVSGVRHRPASSYEDTLTLGAGDARTEALWRVHRARLAAMLQKLRVGHPSPRTDRYDPFALRGLLLLGVFVLLMLGLPLRCARQGRGGPHRRLGDAALLYREAAGDVGRWLARSRPSSGEARGSL